MAIVDWNKISELGVLSSKDDQGAYKEFLKAVSEYLQFKVRSSVPHNHIEDVVQEVLIAIHKSFHTYDPQKNIRPWINAIAHYKVCDFLRTYYKNDLKEDAISDDLLAIPSADAQSRLLLEKLISSLKETERIVFLMLKFDGKSVAEVSESLGKSQANIKVICYRAIKNMRELLSKEEFGG